MNEQIKKNSLLRAVVLSIVAATVSAPGEPTRTASPDEPAGSAAKADLFGNKTFAQWRAAGQDQHSIIADPLFVDPSKGDFRLRQGSPAAQIGFEPWDFSAVGPRPHRAASKQD